MAIARGSEHKKHVNGDKDEDCSSKFDELELQVANILLELSSLISIKKRKRVVNCTFEFKCNWGMTKRRSAVVNPPKIEFKIRDQIVHSPNTPLSFPTSASASASASDSTPKKKTPLHMRVKELKKAVKERLQTQQQLKESIEKAEEYKKIIKADNSALKAQKRKLIVGEKGEEKGAVTEGGSSKQEAHKPWINPDYYHIHEASTSTSTQLNQQPPLIYPYHHHHHHHVYAGQWPLQFHYYHHQPYPMLQFQHQHQHQQKIKQMVEIDLNITPSPTPEDEQMIRRLEAQEARKNRLRVNKEKRTRPIINP